VFNKSLYFSTKRDEGAVVKSPRGLLLFIAIGGVVAVGGRGLFITAVVVAAAAVGVLSLGEYNSK
jgi:hypothetical protein